MRSVGRGCAVRFPASRRTPGVPVTLRKPPKAEGSTRDLIARIVGLLVLLAVFAGLVWVAATNSQADALERSDPVVNAPGEHLVVDGRPIHVRRFGSSDEPYLLIHDDVQVGGLSLVLLGRALEEREAGAVVPDLLGFGLSGRVIEPGRHYTIAGQTELLAALLDEMELSDLSVVGVGWGGGVAAELAVTRPELVAELVLVGTSSLPPESGRWEPLEALPFGIGDAVAYTLEGASQSARDRFFEGCDVDDWCDVGEDDDAYRRTVEVPSTAAAIRARRATGSGSVAPDRLDEISVPVTLIQAAGAEGDFTERFDDARVEEIDAPKDRIPLAAPDRLAGLIVGD